MSDLHWVHSAPIHGVEEDMKAGGKRRSGESWMGWIPSSQTFAVVCFAFCLIKWTVVSFVLL